MFKVKKELVEPMSREANVNSYKTVYHSHSATNARRNRFVLSLHQKDTTVYTSVLQGGHSILMAPLKRKLAPELQLLSPEIETPHQQT